MTSSAIADPVAVSCTPLYGTCVTMPIESSFLTIADADAGVTPRRSASAFVVTAQPSPRSWSA
jgi:hypothetical protein